MCILWFIRVTNLYSDISVVLYISAAQQHHPETSLTVPIQQFGSIWLGKAELKTNLKPFQRVFVQF